MKTDMDRRIASKILGNRLTLDHELRLYWRNRHTGFGMIDDEQTKDVISYLIKELRLWKEIKKRTDDN